METDFYADFLCKPVDPKIDKNNYSSCPRLYSWSCFHLILVSFVDQAGEIWAPNTALLLLNATSHGACPMCPL